jgi:hypothetical protein
LSKKKFFSFFLILALCAFLCICAASHTAPRIKHPCTQAYTPGHGSIQGDVDVEYFTKIDKRFAIGADANGKAVFKDPDAAYDALVETNKDGIALIRKECHLPPFSKKYYKPYGNLGWQVTGGTQKARRQAAFVSSFVDIYENSFE